MVTLKEVAAKAGVSIATVSCALNNSPKVTQKTKEHVLKIAKELNYTPNKTARNLKKRKTETIGLFLRDFGGPFYNELIQGVQVVVMEHEYDLIVCSTYGGTKSTGYNFLKEKGVDGAIILASNLEDQEILDISRDNFPMIMLDRELKGNGIHNIRIDNKAGAYEATEHLIEVGCEKIACILGPSDSYDSRCRHEGLAMALDNANLPIMTSYVSRGDFTEKSGYKAMKEILSSGIPDGVFCLNDEMAIGAIGALSDAGIDVPSQVKVIGFDDIKLASYVSPSLSTISHPKYDWGKAAAELLFDALLGKGKIESQILATELVVRESTK